MTSKDSSQLSRPAQTSTKGSLSLSVCVCVCFVRFCERKRKDERERGSECVCVIPLFCRCLVSGVLVVFFLLIFLRRDAYGACALHIACHEGHMECVDLLLRQRGIDVNAGGWGWTVCREIERETEKVRETEIFLPFPLPLSHSHKVSFSLLLSPSLSFSLLLSPSLSFPVSLSADLWGRVPLHHAARKGRYDVILRLVEENADVDRCTNDGYGEKERERERFGRKSPLVLRNLIS